MIYTEFFTLRVQKFPKDSSYLINHWKQISQTRRRTLTSFLKGTNTHGCVGKTGASGGAGPRLWEQAGGTSLSSFTINPAASKHRDPLNTCCMSPTAFARTEHKADESTILPSKRQRGWKRPIPRSHPSREYNTVPHTRDGVDGLFIGEACKTATGMRIFLFFSAPYVAHHARSVSQDTFCGHTTGSATACQSGNCLEAFNSPLC